MSITFLKRQKEMKRLEKQRIKAERRAQRKLEKNAPEEVAVAPEDSGVAPADSQPKLDH